MFKKEDKMKDEDDYRGRNNVWFYMSVLLLEKEVGMKRKRGAVEAVKTDEGKIEAGNDY